MNNFEVEVDVVEGGEMASIIHALSASRRLSMSFLTKASVVGGIL